MLRRGGTDSDLQRLALEVEAGVVGGQRGGGHDGDLLAALDLVAAVVVGVDEHRVGDVLDLGVVVWGAFVDGEDAVGRGSVSRSGRAVAA